MSATPAPLVVNRASIVAMPPEATIVRAALEECDNAKDSTTGSVSSVAFLIPLPDGRTGQIRCSYGRNGSVRVTISTLRKTHPIDGTVITPLEEQP